MPLIKRWRGRRIRRTRRKGSLILIKLARSAATDTPTDWVPMTARQYREGLSCSFSPSVPALLAAEGAT